MKRPLNSISNGLSATVAVVRGARRGYYPFPYQWYMHRHKLIFVHIPRTGGTAILRHLGSRTGRDHSTWYGYFATAPKLFKRYLKVAMVRNPWERVWSVYKYLLAGGNQLENDGIALKKRVCAYVDFPAFCREGLPVLIQQDVTLLRSQTSFIFDPHDNLMLDHVMRFENFENDLPTLMKRIGLSTQIDHLNASPQGSILDYKDAYAEDSRAVAVVGELYARDVRLLGYDFSGTGRSI